MRHTHGTFPDGSPSVLVQVPADKSAYGEGYNTIYTKSRFYEFHSLPYSELPPVMTEVKTADYEVVKDESGRVAELIKKLNLEGVSPTVTNYVLFKKRSNGDSKKEADLSQPGKH